MPQLAPHIFELLHQQGVQHSFGIPGDFALTLYDALAKSKIAPIIMTHEPCVGFAADAYSRIRGLGLAVMTYSVGGLNMVNAVAGAYAEKSVFPEGHPQYIGIYNGEAGDPYVRNTVEESDCLIMLGVFMTDINLGMFTAHLEPKRTVYVTSERIAIKHHEYPNVLFEDMIATLASSKELPNYDLSLIVPMQPRVAPNSGTISMSGLMYELNQFIDGNTLLVTDVGDALFAADDIKMQEGTSFLCPAFYASMGFGVPGVIGAQLADPFRRAIALVGDGAFQMTGMELLTAKRLGLNPIIIVVNNGSFTSLRSMGHEEADFVKIASINYAQFATLLGGTGFVVETGTQFKQALQKARDSESFSIIDVRLLPEDISPALQRMSELFAKTLKG